MTTSPSTAALNAARKVYPRAVAIGTHLALFGQSDAEEDAAREQALHGLALIIDAELATERQAYIAALEAARVFITPLQRLKPGWDEYKQDAADRINAALRNP